MTQAEFEKEDAIHRKVYEEMKDQIRREYAGMFVGIAQGRLIAAAPEYREVKSAIEKLKPVPEYYLLFPADEGPIWDVIDSFGRMR
jgi:hypothetical protein